MYIYLVRFLVFVVAFSTAYVMYYRFFKPTILTKRGITNTNRAIQIKYYVDGNTVLFNVIPSGIWSLFNGSDAYVYGQPMNETCGKGYQSAYQLTPDPNLPNLQYKCVEELNGLLQSYSKNKPGYIFYQSDNPSEFSVQDAMNLLLEQGIVNL